MIHTSFSQKLIIKIFLKVIIVLVVLLLVAYFLLGWSISNIISRKSWLDPQSLAIGISGILGFLVGVLEIKILDKIGDWFDRELFALKNAFKGNRGERRTFERLSEMLGDRYHLYRNFKIPNLKFDIDSVIVGPKGIITFEIKNLGGKNDRFRFEGMDTYKITRYSNGNEVTCKFGGFGNMNPIREAKRHNVALEEWLVKNSHDRIKVKGAILMTGEAKIEEIKDPAIYVIKGLDGIKNFFDGCFDDQRFTEKYCEELNLIFQKSGSGK